MYMTHQCDICSLNFTCARNLRDHLKSNRHKRREENKKDGYECVCGKVYKYRQSCYHHKKTCTLVNPPVSDVNTQIQEMRNAIAEENNTQDTMVENSDQVEQQNDPPNEIAELREEIAVLREEIAQLRSKNNDVPTAVQRVSSGRRKWKPAEREQIAIKQDNKCNRCQATLSMYFHIDHKTALQYGGLDDTENLQALCYECHIQKSILENRARDRIQDAIHVILNEEATLHHS